MTTLNYSRDELPVECPDCSRVMSPQVSVSRDTYEEVVKCQCDICHKVYTVTITED